MPSKHGHGYCPPGQKQKHSFSVQFSNPSHLLIGVWLEEVAADSLSPGFGWTVDGSAVSLHSANAGGNGSFTLAGRLLRLEHRDYIGRSCNAPCKPCTDESNMPHLPTSLLIVVSPVTLYEEKGDLHCRSNSPHVERRTVGGRRRSSLHLIYCCFSLSSESKA